MSHKHSQKDSKTSSYSKSGSSSGHKHHDFHASAKSSRDADIFDSDSDDSYYAAARKSNGSSKQKAPVRRSTHTEDLYHDSQRHRSNHQGSSGSQGSGSARRSKHPVQVHHRIFDVTAEPSYSSKHYDQRYFFNSSVRDADPNLHGSSSRDRRSHHHTGEGNRKETDHRYYSGSHNR